MAHCAGARKTVLFRYCFDFEKPAVLRVSKLTDYATVVMACLAARGTDVASAQTLAESARLEVPTVSKLLKQLAQAGLVVSTRGTNGGYRLARAPERITIADIVTAMEGPIGMTECSAHAGLCDHESHCGVRVNWQRINQAIAGALDSVTLADMVKAPSRRGTAIPLRVATA
jgi:FeS assembly SUF system regulator